MTPPKPSITITNEDITWVEKLLGLESGAFDSERVDALKEMGQLDIQACPGSGKTTLVVAKLAILARKWEHPTRGICVVSHTNVARQEIQNRLGRTEVGQKLLSYPHYIGTIHGFVNQFVALPWIRSKGWPISLIDTQITLNRRWQSLRQSTRNSRQLQGTQEKALESKKIGIPQTIRSGRGVLGESSAMGIELRHAIKTSYESGYFTYDEMFLFAEEAQRVHRGLHYSLSNRFPVIIIDEAQDSSEAQCSILSKLLPEKEHFLAYHRFGDGNQAIFHSTYASSEVSTNPFPDSANVKDIAKSHRLHSSIAKLADPLGLQPYNMQGTGGKKEEASEHSIFLYDENSINKVLPKFAALVLDQFSDSQLSGVNCFAVGQVHSVERDDPIGSNVQHYWGAYNPEINKAEPMARHLIDFFRSAVDQVQITKALNKGLDLVSKGLIKLLQNEDIEVRPATRYPYRHLRVISEKNIDSFTTMFSQIQSSMTGSLSEENWVSGLLEPIVKWCNDCFELNINVNHPFLQWRGQRTSPEPSQVNVNPNTNVFSYQHQGREVNIQLGSIHSVKGQTHRATLVLDTFWYDKNLPKIVDWLCNKKQGESGTGARNLNRLKCHYVAMTRPTDLLCLALNKTDIDSATREALTETGWNLVDLEV